MKISRFIPVLALVCGWWLPVRADLADAVVAIVNDTVITQSQVQLFAEPVIESLRTQYAGQPAALQKALGQAWEDSLDQLVERQLILHDFQKEGYKIPDTVIEDDFQRQMRERFGDRVTMIKTLQAEGMTVEEFRQKMRDQYIEEAMRSENVSRELLISPHKVELYYQQHQADFKLDDQVKLRILTLNKVGDGTDAKRLAGEILSEVRNGASFKEMAMIYSQDAQQHQGGDRGWVDRTVMRPELADAAFGLKTGQTSEVIDLSAACYLLHVDQVSTAHVKPLIDVRGSIEKILLTEEHKRLQKQWIDSLKAKTFVRLY